MQSCVTEDFNKVSDNVAIQQSFSIPVSQTTLKYDSFDPALSSNIPGPYGSLYFYTLPFPNNNPFLIKSALVEFNLNDSKNQQQWIKRVDFRILVENNYPADILTQIYLLDANNRPIDSVFVTGPQRVASAQINAQGEAVSPSSQIFDVTFEGTRLDNLKKSNLLLYKIYIATTNKQVNTIRLNGDNQVVINLGARLLLEYNLQDTSQ
ncbi:MAG: hypothetical protein Q8928_00830 [Bacteroidota bacterium]|nr:hypothetical protein [Bacteroidota bacterium]